MSKKGIFIIANVDEVYSKDVIGSADCTYREALEFIDSLGPENKINQIIEGEELTIQMLRQRLADSLY